MAAPVSEPVSSSTGRSASLDEARDGRRRAPTLGEPLAKEAEAARGEGADRAERADVAEVPDVGALRRRLDDLGAQQRKTHATTHQLAESVAALVAGQRQRLRWLNLNSFVAYVMFTVLLGTAFYTLYARRADALAHEQRALVAARDAATQRAERAVAELAAARQGSQRALAAYQLYEKGLAEEAAAAHAQLAGQLTPLEEAALSTARARAAKAGFDRAFEQGLAAYRAGDVASAIAPLEQAVAVGEAASTEVPAARVALARYHLGMSHARAGKLAQAVTAFDAALAQGVDVADARYQLAMALDRAGDFARARTEYEKFASGHPKLLQAVYAMRRSAILVRFGRAAPPLPPTGAGPATWAPGVATPGVAPGAAGAPAAHPGAASAPWRRPAAAPASGGAIAPPASTPAARPPADPSPGSSPL